jgi:hypothetical protein
MIQKMLLYPFCISACWFHDVLMNRGVFTEGNRGLTSYRDKGAYDHPGGNLDDEEEFLQEWRKDGPLGILIAIINYIKPPQQYNLFSNFQKLNNAELPTDQCQILEPVSQLLPAGTCSMAPLGELLTFKLPITLMPTTMSNQHHKLTRLPLAGTTSHRMRRLG